MVTCEVNGCSNTTGVRHKDKNLSFFKIPSGKIGEQWKAQINRDKMTKDPRICHEHFTQDDFERDLKNELLNVKQRRILKPNAVPSIFSCTPSPPKKRGTREPRAAKKARQEQRRILKRKAVLSISSNRPNPPKKRGTREPRAAKKARQEEVEVPADQQLWYQEVKSSVDQEEPGVLHLKEEPGVLHLKEEPGVLHLKEEPEELHCSQEGEQLVVKQETDAVTLTPARGENDHSEDQTLYMKAEDGAAQTESVVNLPVISSVVGAANIDLLISNGSHASISHEGEKRNKKKNG
ncbi:THAP domain-containing protein 1-like isoform X1 [Antennarius striatus]|uniref:THAP domain-containing protein 1-like isoform X1 n=2 Tax=Antennarius striatus TaxID=241820 RepID=UPI0035AF01D5